MACLKILVPVQLRLIRRNSAEPLMALLTWALVYKSLLRCAISMHSAVTLNGIHELTVDPL